MMHKIGEQTEFEPRHLDGRAVEGDARGARIELKRAAFEFGLGKASAAPQQSPHARDDLLHLKGLRDVVVRTRIDARDLFAPAVARGQDENRRLQAVSAPALQDADAVELWQAQLE